MHLTRTSLAVLAAGLFASGCGSSGSLSGKVMADGAPVSGQPVVLQGGTRLLTASTGSDGSYAFRDLDDSTYLLSVDVPSTREGHEQAAVRVNGAVQVPDLVFTGVGALNGTVTDPNGTPLSNAQVLLLGTELSAVTDASGAFSFTGAPVGPRTVSVTTPNGHAEANVTVARGEAQSLSLQLTANPPGTVTGSATFFSGTNADLITVTAVGSGVSTHPKLDGSYSLQLPAGTWTITASAPYYPTQTLGQVTVTSGGTETVAPAALSLYTELPTLGQTDAYWSLASSGFDYAGRTATLLALNESISAPSFFRFDHQTHALTLLSVGNPPILSADGSWFALKANGAVVFEKVSTRSSFQVPVAGSIDRIFFTHDSTGAVVVEGGSPGKVTSVQLSDGTTQSVASYGTRPLANGELLIQTTSASANDWSVAGRGPLSVAFSGITSLVTRGNSANGIAIGVEGCTTAPCPVDVLGPQATHAVRIQGLTASGAPSIESWYVNTAAVNDGSRYTVVNTTDGSSSTLPAGAQDVEVSPDGKRIAYTLNSEQDLYESALPLPATLTPVISSTAPVHGSWLSLTRFGGYDNAPSSGSAYKFLIDSGNLTRDGDYTASSGAVANTSSFASLTWLSSGGKSRVQSGGGDVIDSPTGATSNPSLVSPEMVVGQVDGVLTLAGGTHVAVNWDSAATFLFGGSVPPVYGKVPIFPAIIGGIVALADGSSLSLVDVSTGQQILLSEPLIPAGTLGISGTLSATNTVSLVVAPASLDPSTGAAKGGRIALIPTVIP